MKKYFYLNGKILPLDRPAIQFNDLGVLRGYGVFDFMRTHNRRVFHWEDHWKRFVSSAKSLDLKIPIKKEATARQIKVLIRKNGCTKEDVSIRLVLIGGVTNDGISQTKPNFAILLENIYDFPKKCYDRGVKLISFEYQRLLPETKNNNYIHAVRLQKELKRKGASEILFTSGEKILECSTANFFIFKGATLITTKKDILGGITRKIVLKIARKKFKVEEREVKMSELNSASEAFVTGTSKGILPVRQIDNKKIGTGKVGENTKWLMGEYSKYIKNYK